MLIPERGATVKRNGEGIAWGAPEPDRGLPEMTARSKGRLVGSKGGPMARADPIRSPRQQKKAGGMPVFTYLLSICFHPSAFPRLP